MAAWDFSDDEWFFMLAACMASVLGAYIWYRDILRAARRHNGQRVSVWLAWTPIAAMIVLIVVLWGLGDPVYVAGHFDYTMLFLAGGASWIFNFANAFPLLGLSARDDVLERQNQSAAVAISGGMMGIMLAYAGSNIGNGPTIWTTLFPALIAAVALLVLWAILELIGGARDAITIEHDLAGGVRLASFLIGAGAILGRAMASDWHGWPDTVQTFIQLGWPTILLALAASALNRTLAPNPRRLYPSVIYCGLIPSAVLLLLVVGYIVSLGWPEVAPMGKYVP